MKTKRRYFVIENGGPVYLADSNVVVDSRGKLFPSDGAIGIAAGQWYYIDEPIPEPEIECDGWCAEGAGNKPIPLSFTTQSRQSIVIWELSRRIPKNRRAQIIAKLREKARLYNDCAEKLEFSKNPAMDIDRPVRLVWADEEAK